MRLFVFIGIGLFLLSGAAIAETLYVSDLKEITVRTGQGNKHKIISMIKSGQKVELLERGDAWSLVRVANGKEGWVLTRYLTTAIPKKILFDSLQKKHSLLEAKTNSLLEENSRLKKENRQLRMDFSSSKKKLGNLSKAYKTLKDESAEFIELKDNYNRTASQLAEQKEKAMKLEEELTTFQLRQNIRWFLSGAGVLIIGFIIGYSAKRQRKRSSLY